MARAGRPPGTPKTGGRLPGTPNHLTTDIKAMILGALHRGGGEDWLLKQMDAHPGAFMLLLGKILPTTVNATIKREVSKYTADELRAIIHDQVVLRSDASTGIH